MKQILSQKEQFINNLDEKYSQRFIELDPSGYFLIKVSHETNELIVEHFSNNIDETGLATDPETGEPLKCNDNKERSPIKVFKGKSAKEIGIQITEGHVPKPLTKLDHALYLGRELQKAEFCLTNGKPYVQD
ncbi:MULTISPECIES: DUF4346 domain-containing protein [Prochlorococcus]|uniref:Dihydropteroate synthase n=1 Tax=Prochlorococcus marinus (strain SARG / CCMP1375 / SS120) TaxID=167539 RepID=Q7VE90_PROMA|nr:MULTISPECIES: DUF4346 domain-containing protein [Prochlorococcus]AAP99169.1 Dihydropteroate synthase [Prochlorococcus marinus subsp. marinus str. CCMP1375]KGG11562.1 Pterin-binding family [Prochlorococcus marinus str. LG]KGG18484.1 Pterin-binding family [Prochlorococcus marinus str. SS2]KGG22757.1 Pterin-binding family [Prochlorococcus marinus str. SS35]KGG32633.1 Pterin-binding family [Prochlorococcus marinus str. SS51]